MAKLNGVEGKAHVGLDQAEGTWGGYILVAPVPSNRQYFRVWPLSDARAVYEGPIFFLGIYCIGHGEVYVVNVQHTLQEFRVEFKTVEGFKIEKVLDGPPTDFIPKE
jgi:hypothetical protein